MAVSDKGGNLYPVTKVGTGFEDSFLAELTAYIDNNKINTHDGKVILNGLKPDVLVVPTFVWEIGFDSFTISSIYQVGKGLVDKDRGISLRFPKFIRVREDKSLDQANDFSYIVEMYNKSIEFN